MIRPFFSKSTIYCRVSLSLSVIVIIICNVFMYFVPFLFRAIRPFGQSRKKNSFADHSDGCNHRSVYLYIHMRMAHSQMTDRFHSRYHELV